MQICSRVRAQRALMKMIKRITRARARVSVQYATRKHACFLRQPVLFLFRFFFLYLSRRMRSCDPCRSPIFTCVDRCSVFRLFVCACESRKIRSKTCVDALISSTSLSSFLHPCILGCISHDEARSAGSTSGSKNAARGMFEMEARTKRDDIVER